MHQQQGVRRSVRCYSRFNHRCLHIGWAETKVQRSSLPGVFQSLLSAGLAFTALGVRQFLSKSCRILLASCLHLWHGKDVKRLAECLASISCPRANLKILAVPLARQAFLTCSVLQVGWYWCRSLLVWPVPETDACGFLLPMWYNVITVQARFEMYSVRFTWACCCQPCSLLKNPRDVSRKQLCLQC